MGRRYMFADECCLCHSNRYKRIRITGKRSLSRLVTCELVNGGQLLEAARRKEDTFLLQEIEGEDLVAKELQYHHDCYKDCYIITNYCLKKPILPTKCN